VLWEASDRSCGKRLRALVPILIEAMERDDHLQLVPEVRAHLMTMSAATIERALRAVKDRAGGQQRRHAAPSAAIRRSVPVPTFDGWNDPPPGFVEADLVAHSGTTAKGSYVQTLTLTDIATGWTECAPLLVREQKNGAVVRHGVGYRRYEGVEAAAAALVRLYAALRLFVNFFQPSFKLAGKTRDGAKVRAAAPSPSYGPWKDPVRL
jgi:hypothetical protein